MKVAVLGKGKTGQKVIEQLDPQSEYTVFDSTNPPTKENLKGHDVIISFLPGEAFLSYIDTFIDSKVPVITGSTGFEWPSDIHKRLEEANLVWVRSTNFSLGMNLIYEMIKVASKADKFFNDPKFKIHETHHIMKLDAPSGTALSWQDWSEHTCEISSTRTGDVVGDHELRVETATENIIIKHQAKDRGIFANGALWVARKLLTENNIPKGLNDFNTIAAQELS